MARGISLRMVLVAFLAVLANTGCASAVYTVKYGEPYGGTIWDTAVAVGTCCKLPQSPGWRILAAIDLPFSVVLDTALLPYSVPRYYFVERPRRERLVQNVEKFHKCLSELKKREDGKYAVSTIVPQWMYHAKDCDWVSKEKDRIYILSKEEAEEYGMTPHKCVKKK